MRLSARLCASAARASSRTRLITTPIFYVNGPPHVGHLYSALLGDAAARSFRLRGDKVIFSTGTDEHGLKIAVAAKARGVPTQAFADEISATFRSLFAQFNISNDVFIRTTDAEHKKTVEWMWRRLEDRGYIYKGRHEGWYSRSDEAFLTDTQVCLAEDFRRPGEAGAAGEAAPLRLDRSRLTDSKARVVSRESGHAVEWLSESNYMFRLSAFREPILAWLERATEAIVPGNRRNEVLSWLHGSAQTTLGAGGESDLFGDLSVSRPRDRVAWGVPVPGDPEHTIYVWLDALTNYLTVAGGGAAAERAEEAIFRRLAASPTEFHPFASRGVVDGDALAGWYAVQPDERGHPEDGASARNPEGEHSRTWEPRWMVGDGVDAQSRSVDGWTGLTWEAWPPTAHVIGKDIVRFHCVYWPAFLLGAGLALPDRVVAHGHWTVGKVKMSKSLQNVVDPSQFLLPTDAGLPVAGAVGVVGAASKSMAAEGSAASTPPSTAPPQFSRDVLRFYLLREGGLADDGDFDVGRLESTAASALADTLGNLVSRATAPTLLPTPALPAPTAPLGSAERDVLWAANALAGTAGPLWESLEPAKASQAAMEVAQALNRYFAAAEPWNLRPGKPTADAARLSTVLWTTLEALRVIAIVLQPAMPDAMGRLLTFLGVPLDRRGYGDAVVSPPSGCTLEGPADAWAAPPPIGDAADLHEAWRLPGRPLGLSSAVAAGEDVRSRFILFPKAPPAPSAGSKGAASAKSGGSGTRRDK